MNIQKIKNFFQYKGRLSRSGFLLILIAIFLTGVSFTKGIQILIFIPAFILSIFCYSLFTLHKIKKNFSYNFYNDKNGNHLKIFLKNGKTYNCILANRNHNGSIDFLIPENGLIYSFDPEKEYNLILYVFGSFDVFRIVFPIGKIQLYGDKSSYDFYISEKYDEEKDISKIDSLKTTLSQVPYVREKQTLSYNQNKGLEFKLIANEKLKILGDENLGFLHFILILLGSIGIIIEWQDQILTTVLLSTIVLVFLFRKKRGNIKNIYKNILLIGAFLCMLLFTYINRDMSGPGSVFLIQILLIAYLFPKEFRNSFLYIFLLLFVFVAISLFSNQIRFILLFLLYIFISIYLLFFISGTESFEDRKYRIGTVIKFSGLIKTTGIIIILMFFLFFIIPHGNKVEDRTTFANNQNEGNISGFNDEISLENVESIREDNRKVIVVENITDEDVRKLGMDYFRGKRFNFFDGIKWYDNFPRKANILGEKSADLFQELTIKYFLNGGKNLFLPASPLSIEGTQITFGSRYGDFTVLRSFYGINEPISLTIDFEVSETGEIIDRFDDEIQFFSRLDSQVQEDIQRYIDSIPIEYTQSPELLTQYIRDLSGFEYSMSDISSDIPDFLYGKQKGHCEYFASILMLTLQYFGHNPTLVTGFAGGEYNDLAQSYIVRAKHAHAWVELYNEESQTWEIYDATPADRSSDQSETTQIYQFIVDIYDYIDIKWYIYIVNYTGDQQKKLYQYLYNNKQILIFFIFSLFVFYGLWTFIKRGIFFFQLNEKEKKLFILSKYYKQENNIIHYISQNDKKFAKKLESYAYGNQGNITYGEIYRYIRKNRNS